jgi:hypothetical protein
MGKQASPKQNKGGANPDRKNGKAWKKNPKGNPAPTGKTIEGYTVKKHAERAIKQPLRLRAARLIGCWSLVSLA